jgi:hypothetical protein
VAVMYFQTDLIEQIIGGRNAIITRAAKAI